MNSSPLMWTTAAFFITGFVAGFTHWLQEFRANNLLANNHLPLTSKPLSSRRAHG